MAKALAVFIEQREDGENPVEKVRTMLVKLQKDLKSNKDSQKTIDTGKRSRPVGRDDRTRAIMETIPNIDSNNGLLLSRVNQLLDNVTTKRTGRGPRREIAKGFPKDADELDLAADAYLMYQAIRNTVIADDADTFKPREQ